MSDLEKLIAEVEEQFPVPALPEDFTAKDYRDFAVARSARDYAVYAAIFGRRLSDKVKAP